MKKTIALLSFCILSSYGFSQDKESIKSKNESKIEAFGAESGSLIEKSNDEIGKIGSIKIQTSVLTNLLTNTKLKGLRIEKPTTSQYSSTHVSFLDEDEIDAVLKSVEILKERIQSTPTSYVEVIFTARSGFEFGAYYSKEWKYFIQVDKYKSDSMFFMGMKDLEEFEIYVKQGRELLKNY